MKKMPKTVSKCDVTWSRYILTAEGLEYIIKSHTLPKRRPLKMRKKWHIEVARPEHILVYT